MSPRAIRRAAERQTLKLAANASKVKGALRRNLTNNKQGWR